MESYPKYVTSKHHFCWQLQFKRPTPIFSFATQGRHNKSEWTTNYRVIWNLVENGTDNIEAKVRSHTFLWILMVQGDMGDWMTVVLRNIQLSFWYIVTGHSRPDSKLWPVYAMGDALSNERYTCWRLADSVTGTATFRLRAKHPMPKVCFWITKRQCQKGKSHIKLNPSRRCLTCGVKWTFCRTGP